MGFSDGAEKDSTIHLCHGVGTCLFSMPSAGIDSCDEGSRVGETGVEGDVVEVESWGRVRCKACIRTSLLCVMIGGTVESFPFEELPVDRSDESRASSWFCVKSDAWPGSWNRFTERPWWAIERVGGFSPSDILAQAFRALSVKCRGRAR